VRFLEPSKATPGRPFNWTAILDASEALRLISVDWWAPVGRGVNVIFSTAGRAYRHEFGRWCMDPVVTEIHPYRVNYPTMQDYPDPMPGAVTLSPVSGELEI